MTNQRAGDLQAIPAAVPLRTGMRSRLDDQVSLPERLGVIRELMSALHMVTQSGQEYVMHKMLGILRTEILREGLPLTDGQLGAVMNALTELEHEVGRVAPLPAAFNDKARVVVDVLARAWSDRPGKPPLVNL